jgi:plasmid stabilization system protein ParE
VSAYHVEIAPAAERDIREAFLWYADRSQLIADAFRTEVFDAIERLGTGPLGKAADTLGNRRRVLHRFPYAVVYEEAESSEKKRGPGSHCALPVDFVVFNTPLHSTDLHT